jgi:hypothetical protein
MNDAEDFEDWSHPTRRSLSMPPRHGTVRWARVFAVLVALLMFWGAWYTFLIVRAAYRVVFGS